MCGKGIVWAVCVALLSLAGRAPGDLETDLVAHWEFEGDCHDSAGTNHGTAQGDAKISNDDQRGSVMEFDGTGDYVEIPNSPSLNITDDQITLAVWTWHDDVTGPSEIVISKGVDNAVHKSPYFAYGLHTRTNGQPRFWITRGGTAANAPGSSNLKPGQWYHVAGVYDGAQMKTYLNGALVGSSKVTGNLTGYDTVLRLGNNGGLTEPMGGMLDDIRIYKRTLSEAELYDVMQGIGMETEFATDPVPADEAVDVARDVVLSWTPGAFAATHDVYLGTSLDDVTSW